LVTRDRPIRSKSHSGDNQQQQQHQQPDLYCHRRTDDKRIFPSLYDMFVGGVSLANEPATVTARRELAEELGLTAALTSATAEKRGHDAQKLVPQPQQEPLSERLLQCVVCTAYNRCVVDLFAYTCDTRSELITWQPEEVAWGAFVSYAMVEAAADRSIQRLADRHEWPGQFPPVQSKRQGDIEHEEDTDLHDETVREWRSWNFVPDGLLVWEKWLKAVE
jgi:8-oxo-dGTP pyrophosphatase MutT (NUDIX family)